MSTVRRLTRRSWVAVPLVTLSLLTAPVTSGASRATSPDPMLEGVSALGRAAAVERPGGPITPPSGSWFGAIVNPDRSTPEGTKAEVTALEADIGRKLDINHRFYTFKQPITGAPERWDIANGRIPLVTWGASDTIKLRNGSQDAWVKQQAAALRDLKAPVFLRFYHEMDGDRRTRIVHSPADFIAAWRRVHRLFQEVGATNVAFVWCGTAWKWRQENISPKPQDFWPGGDYVDWVAADGYVWYPARPYAKWNSWQQVWQPFYDWAVTLNKPIMAAEYGVLEDTARPGRKAQWFTEAAETLKTSMPQFQAIVYFDTKMVKDYEYDWRLRTSDSSLKSWKVMANDPYFNPRDR